MQLPVLLSVALLLSIGCFPPPNTTGRVTQPETSARLVSMDGGAFETAASVSQLTYVIDTSKSLCFAVADRIQSGTLGAIGLTPVDCCVLRSFVSASAQAWSASLPCASPASAPPPSP